MVNSADIKYEIDALEKELVDLGIVEPDATNLRRLIKSKKEQLASMQETPSEMMVGVDEAVEIETKE